MRWNATGVSACARPRADASIRSFCLPDIEGMIFAIPQVSYPERAGSLVGVKIRIHERGVAEVMGFHCWPRIWRTSTITLVLASSSRTTSIPVALP